MNALNPDESFDSTLTHALKGHEAFKYPLLNRALHSKKTAWKSPQIPLQVRFAVVSTNQVKHPGKADGKLPNPFPVFFLASYFLGDFSPVVI